MRKLGLIGLVLVLCLCVGCGGMAVEPATGQTAPEETPPLETAIPVLIDYYDPSLWAGCDEMPDVVENAEPFWGEGEAARKDGAYTSGLPALDGVITDILAEIGADEMSDYQALMAAFLYVAQRHDYIHHELDEYDFGDGENWTAHRALVFFQSGGGVCYDYASAFCVLARALGYEAYNMVGQVFGREHGYVCIPQEDRLVLYDPELASIEPDLYPDLTLFQFLDTDGDYKCYFWE